ncbi:MAG: GAF domain-containing sensor histidine kinase [Anaerolineae bacterium]
MPALLQTDWTTNHLLSMACLAIIYGMALGVNMRHRDLVWTGLIRLPMVVVWVLIGWGASLWVAVIGMGIAGIYGRWQTPVSWRAWHNGFINSTLSLIAFYLVYNMSGGAVPVLDDAGRYQSVIPLWLALLTSTALSTILLSLMVYHVSPRQIFTRPLAFLLSEGSVLLTSVVLPVIYVQANILAFLVILMLIATQIYRQAQVKQKETQLQQNLQEIRSLNHLGGEMSTYLSMHGAIEAVYQELNQLLNASTIYIAIYNDDQNTLEYSLVMVDGQAVQWDKHELSPSLEQYVIQEKQAIRYTQDEAQRRLRNMSDSSALQEAQYMIAPLMVSVKVIGLLGVTHATRTDAFSEHDFTLFQTISRQASLAIRNAMLYDRSVRLADNLSIINQSLQGVMFNLDRRSAFKSVCQIASEITHTDKAALFLIDTETGQMTLAESVGFEAGHLPHIQHPMRFDYATRIINDVTESDDSFLIQQAETAQFQACLQVPLRNGALVVGSLNVYHDAPYFYEPPEVHMLEMLTSQIMAALDNAELLQALELYASEQAQLVQLSRIAGSTLDLDRIIHDVCDILTQMIHVSRVAIGIWSADLALLEIKMPDEQAPNQLHTHLIDVMTIPELAAMREERATNAQIYRQVDTTRSAGLQAYMSAYSDQALIVSPMHLKESQVGVILLGNSRPREYHENDFRLLEMANHQIAVQIHNARVHAKTQAQLANRLQQLTVIEEITQQISESLEFDQIIEKVLEACIQSTQSDFASIALLVNEKLATFEIVWRELVGDQLMPHQTTISLMDSAVNHVAQTGEVLIIPNHDDFPAYFHPIASAKTFRSSLYVPMIARNKVIGVITIESAAYNFFTREQASFIQSLAGHTAISIDNTNLLSEREQQIITLNELRTLSLDALNVMHSETVYDAILRATSAMLQADITLLYRYDESQTDAHLIRRWDAHLGQPTASQDTLPIQLLTQSYAQERVQFIRDTRHLHADGQAVPYQGLIVMPITRRQQVCEVVVIAYHEAQQFTVNDHHSIDLLMVQIAGHLENVMLNSAITTSNDRMRAILDSTRDGIILLDTGGRIQDVNSAATLLTGIDLQAYLLQPLTAMLTLPTHQQATLHTWQEIITSYEETPENIDNRIVSFQHEHETVHVKLLVTQVRDDGGIIRGYLLVLRDITEEKELQNFRETMQSMVLHDLRSPLTAIVTSMYIAENILTFYDGDFEELKASLDETFAASLNSAEDLLRQIDTLRDLPMINQMAVQPQSILIREIAETAYTMLSANFIDANITVKIDVHDDQLVFVDESLIQRVLVNLMHNAFKFTPVGGKVLVQMLSEVNDEGYIQVQVADNGPGIPPEQRERIFGQFVQIDGQKPRAGGKGTGLGLNFCKLAIEAHGGSIWVDKSSPLDGASFTFTVPVIDWRQIEQEIVS